MRRRRRLDVVAADEGAYDVSVFFRDSHVDGAGEETVVHEYEVAAVVDAASRTVRSIEATADVLPWAECPAAVGSAARLVGRPLADLRPWVRRTFTGTSTCTHLNDTLRGLTDVETLIDQLVAAQV
jgi:K+/H+ antiporter YhaU regulatory subunit KhtT